jgi:hypothetical protein
MRALMLLLSGNLLACGGIAIVDGGGDPGERPEPMRCPVEVSAPVPFGVGSIAGDYTIDEITNDGVDAGRYSFPFVGGLDPTDGPTGQVALCRDDLQLEVLSYLWQTTVSQKQTGLFFDFVFDEGITLRVREAGDGVGTMNLFNMPQSFFDGQRVLDVP